MCCLSHSSYHEQGWKCRLTAEMPNALVSVLPKLHKKDRMTHSDPGTQEVGLERAEVQGYPGLQISFGASLGYKTACLKNEQTKCW